MRESFRLPPLFTSLDLILVLIVVVFSAGFYRHGLSDSQGGPLVAVIQADNREVARLGLGADTTLCVRGALGDITVVVSGGAIKFEDSHCPSHICEKTGWVRRAGGAIVCAPNRVLARLERADGTGGAATGMDALSR